MDEHFLDLSPLYQLADYVVKAPNDRTRHRVGAQGPIEASWLADPSSTELNWIRERDRIASAVLASIVRALLSHEFDEVREIVGRAAREEERCEHAERLLRLRLTMSSLPRLDARVWILA